MSKRLPSWSGPATPPPATVFATAFEVLGQVLGPWLRRFGAELLVVGGSISRSLDVIEAPLRSGLSASVPDGFPIVPAGQPELSPLVGAAYPVWQLAHWSADVS